MPVNLEEPCHQNNLLTTNLLLQKVECKLLVFFFSWLALICPVEIMFIIDSSENAKSLLFERQKQFVLRFSTKLMQLHSTGWRLRLRLAAMQYSSTVSLEHNFRDWQDLDVFHSRVASMTFIGHGTYSSYAIANATQVFSRETSPSSLRAALLMTDGMDHPRSPSAMAAGTEAKQLDIRVFTISLSGLPSEGPMASKLRSIASAPAQQHVFSLTDNHLDDRLFNELVSHVCCRVALPGIISAGLDFDYLSVFYFSQNTFVKTGVSTMTPPPTKCTKGRLIFVYFLYVNRFLCLYFSAQSQRLVCVKQASGVTKEAL